MPASNEAKLIGLTLEGTRGTQETGTISKYIAISPDTEFGNKLNLIEDENLRNSYDRWPAIAGTKETDGKIGLDVDNSNICEFLYSLLGKVTITNPNIGVYQHIFQRKLTTDTNPYLMPSYSIYMRRSDNVATYDNAYVLSVAKSITFNQSVDGLLKADISLLSAGEETMSPTFTASFTTNPDPFVFNDLTFYLASTDTVRADVKDFSLTIDNQSDRLRVLNSSQNPSNIITHKKILISGGFTVYFENLTDRTKFLANTSSDLKITYTGTQITGAYYKTLEFFLRQVHFTDYPFSNVDGLLGAQVKFNCYYNTTNTQSMQIKVINNETGTNYGG